MSYIYSNCDSDGFLKKSNVGYCCSCDNCNQAGNFTCAVLTVKPLASYSPDEFPAAADYPTYFRTIIKSAEGAAD
jgi:hypothetical protein